MGIFYLRINNKNKIFQKRPFKHSPVANRQRATMLSETEVQYMKHNLQISVSDKPQRNSMVSCKNITLRERFLRMLFGRKQKITVLVPSDSIEELAITKVKKGDSYEQNNSIT